MLTPFGVWLRPVERTVRVREVPSSNLGTPTDLRRLPTRGSLLFFTPPFSAYRLVAAVSFD